ncbi:J domain-containing protein [Fusibacter ferrireducens]|uniref:J domain-containing protein n=1 Tax=Fusibacter ferrireducens TaxID=2785058 RepID=A0ABR9ZSM5_9FIRM|nr:J domain-containing protein [Fusibacter ferrireducens]MBF4692614.1 J domain-containing protein [Fusibacter ferrireducens]
MTSREKFNDKFYIMNCDMPSDLFTVKGIKKEYRALAKIWHPDVSEVKEALFIMSKINALYQEGQTLIDQNKFYEKERIINRGKKTTDSYKAPEKSSETVNYKDFTENIRRSKRKKSIELKSVDGKCVRFRYLKRVLIDLGYMYVSETYVLLEITKLKRKIFMDSLELIKNKGEGYFKIEVPEVVDTFDTTSHGYIVLKKAKGIEPVVILETVLGYLKPLGNRKICEGIFYDLTALKYMGLTSTGIDKDLWFINVDTGKLHNYGLFFYLHEFSSKLNRAPKDVSDVLSHLKPRDNESLVIDLVKNAIVTLNNKSGLKVDDFHKWITNLKSDSLEMSLAESQVFNRAIESVTTHGFNLESYYQSISYS